MKKSQLSFLCYIFMIMILYSHSVYADQYTYDSLGRVKSIEYDDGSKVVFRYDKNGNIEHVESQGKKRQSASPETNAGDESGKTGNTGQTTKGEKSESDSKKDSESHSGKKTGSSAGKTEAKPETKIVKTQENGKSETVTIQTKTGSYDLSENGTAVFLAPKSSSSKHIKIPDTVKKDGKKYKVTVIAKNAFQNRKNLKKVTIGKNVTTIQSKAFSGCTGLEKVVVKTTKLSVIDKRAFQKVSKNVVFKVPKKKIKKYRKLLKKSGLKKARVKA